MGSTNDSTESLTIIVLARGCLGVFWTICFKFGHRVFSFQQFFSSTSKFQLFQLPANFDIILPNPDKKNNPTLSAQSKWRLSTELKSEKQSETNRWSSKTTITMQLIIYANISHYSQKLIPNESINNTQAAVGYFHDFITKKIIPSSSQTTNEDYSHGV